MKRISAQRLIRLLLGVCLPLLFVFLTPSCSVEKRHYRKGFYVYCKHKKVDEPLAKENRSGDRSFQKTNIGVSSVPGATVITNVPVVISDASNRMQDPGVTHVPLISLLPVAASIGNKTAAETPAKYSKGEKRRKVEWMGIFAFLISVGGWIALIMLSIGWLQVGLFAAGAILAALSMTKMSREPERYVLKTLSFVALLLSLIGLAVMLYAGLIYLLS
jgi:hypothetical protein